MLDPIKYQERSHVFLLYAQMMLGSTPVLFGCVLKIDYCNSSRSVAGLGWWLYLNKRTDGEEDFREPKSDERSIAWDDFHEHCLWLEALRSLRMNITHALIWF